MIVQTVIDFETMPIRQRPAYPPQPVGVSIMPPGENPRYFGWGHEPFKRPRDDGQFNAAKQIIWRVWANGGPVLFHNCKFDIEVAMQYFDVRMLEWERVHDTQFLAFLADPHAPSLALKPLAKDLLGWEPEEKDALAEWVVGNAAMLREVAPDIAAENPPTRKHCGAWIWAAPAELIGPYANGDCTRTRALFEHLMPLVEQHDMTAAYDRERQLVRIWIENERDGMRLDMARLEQEGPGYDRAFALVEDKLRDVLQAPGLNFDADQDVAETLLSRGVVLQADMPLTDKGKWSVSKEELRPTLFQGHFGKQIASALGYRNRLQTCLSTFMKPWYYQAQNNGGRITTSWNSTRNPNGGTRTGRPSTFAHNFLNVAKSFNGRDDEYVHPAFLSVPELPLCRNYILPDDGEEFIHRDFDGQELRLLAHFEQGDLWRAYHADPNVDPHAWVKGFMEPIAQRELPRATAKILNFQAIYGGGVPALQKKLRCDFVEAKMLKAAHDQALPGRRILAEEIKRFVVYGEPIRTWGGRLYFVEPSGADGRSKAYKLINYLIQGSAADVTKQALIDWYDHPLRTARFLVTVYDEINGSAAKGQAMTELAILGDVMELARLVSRAGVTPMRTTAKIGPSWGALRKVAAEEF